MDSTLLDVGAQCSLDSCSYHDFLPIFCSNCSKYFCKDHIHSDLHSCTSLPLESHIQHEKLQRCALDSCDNVSLDAFSSTAVVACPNCSRSFCAEHRHPVSHKCIATTTLPKPSTTIENEKARVLLAKMTSTSASRSPLKKFTKPPIDPTRLAAYRKVELMKMRHKAVPLDPKDKTTSSPLDQRLHLKVRHGNTERLIWARKTLIVGRAIDLLRDRFGIAQSTSTPIRLFQDGAEAPLQNDKPLSEQVDDGSSLYVALDTEP